MHPDARGAKPSHFQKLRKAECTLFYVVPGRNGGKRRFGRLEKAPSCSAGGFRLAFVSDYICGSFAFSEGRNFFANTSCTEESQW